MLRWPLTLEHDDAVALAEIGPCDVHFIVVQADESERTYGNKTEIRHDYWGNSQRVYTTSIEQCAFGIGECALPPS